MNSSNLVDLVIIIILSYGTCILIRDEAAEKLKKYVLYSIFRIILDKVFKN